MSSRKTHRYDVNRFGVYDNSEWPNGLNLFMPMVVVPGTDVLGTRKAKNFTLDISFKNITYYDSQSGTFVPFTLGRMYMFWLLIYVPEGYTYDRNNFFVGDNTSALSIYEPNQNVIGCGLVDVTKPMHFSTKLARNLNSGDQIHLIMLNRQIAPYDMKFDTAITVQYAITY